MVPLKTGLWVKPWSQVAVPGHAVYAGVMGWEGGAAQDKSRGSKGGSFFQPQASGVTEHYPSRQPGSAGEAAGPGEISSLRPASSLLPSLAPLLPCPGQLPTSGPRNPLFQPDTLYKNLKKEGKATQEGAQEPTPPGGPGCSGWTGSVVASDEGGHTSLPLPETA